jgi:pimeloyl-ACP methyl ester carboxylesterase
MARMSENQPLGPAHWAEIAGIRTHCVTAGRGAPVVLIHGGEIGSPTGSLVHWRDCFAALAQEFSVLAYDRPGMGRSGLPLRDEDYTLAAASDHARHLIAAETKGAVHLVAHGTGARIALDLCLGGEIAEAS